MSMPYRAGATGPSARSMPTPLLPADTGATTEAGLAWRRAREIAGTVAAPLPAERVPLATAAGRVLAEPAVAAITLPTADTSAMDGYAVAGTPPWRIIGRVLAGAPAASTPLSPGTAVEIATGAPVPPGAERVVPIERCHADAGLVHPTAALTGGNHIRRAGEDLTPGTPLADAGARVTAALTGLAAHAGLDHLAVRRRPRVLLVATGDEVVGAGLPAPGQVRDAINPMLTALLAGTGAEIVSARHVRDDPALLAAAVTAPPDGPADVVVVSGSSSVGRADHLHRVLSAAGARWHVDGVACRPGHPQALAELPGTWVVGLPGNPYAALVGAVTLLLPLVGALQGRAAPRPLRLPVTGGVEPYADGTRLVPVRLSGDHAVALPGARPASLIVAGGAEALAAIEPGWAPGGAAEVLLLP